VVEVLHETSAGAILLEMTDTDIAHAMVLLTGCEFLPSDVDVLSPADRIAVVAWLSGTPWVPFTVLCAEQQARERAEDSDATR